MDTKDRNLGFIGDTFVNFVKELCIEDCDDLNSLLSNLPNLELDENYVLDDYRSRRKTNTSLRLYVRSKDKKRPSDQEFESVIDCKYETIIIKIGNILLLKYRKRIKSDILKEENPFNHIFSPFTEEAIWQAYLLYQTYHLIGMRWHGAYNRRLFINLFGDIEKINQEPHVNEVNYKRLNRMINDCWSAYLLPSIILLNNCAYVIHCWFDQWKGLIQVTCKIRYDRKKKQIVRFEIVEERVLVKYNCGVFY